MHEDLVGHAEQEVRPLHPKISHARVEPLDPDALVPGSWIDVE